MKIKNIFLSLSLVILLGASALAQSGNDVTVKLINKDGKIVATSNLDSKGNFNLPDVPVGEYTMKVNVNDFHFIKMNAVESDKGTNGQNSTGRGINQPGLKRNDAVAIGEDSAARKTGEIKGSVTQKMQSVDRVDSHMKMQSIEAVSADKIFIKIDGISGLAASDFYLKIKGDLVAREKATSGLKDTLKTQVRVAQPSTVQLESWSWGASNVDSARVSSGIKIGGMNEMPSTLIYQTNNESKLKEGVEVQISIKEKKNLIGHVTIAK